MSETEGRKNEKPPPRRSFSPVIDEMAARKSVRQVMTAEFHDFDSAEPKPTDEVKLATAREKCIELAGRERILNKKYGSTRLELKDALAKTELLKKELLLCESKLSVRPHIEVLQRKVIPTWLLNYTTCPPALKWILAVEFELTTYAKVLRNRLKKLQDRISVEDLGYAFSEFYDAASETMSHDNTPRGISLAEDDWKVLFEKTRLYDPLKQTVIRAMLKPILDQEFKIASNSCTKNDYLLHLNNIDIDLQNDLEDESTCKIIQYCGDFGPRIDHLYFPTHYNHQYIGDVYFVLKNSAVNEVHQLRDVLRKHRKNPQENLHFIYNKITNK